jgi:hypothetical protein
MVDVKKAAISVGVLWGAGLLGAGLVGAVTGTYAAEFIQSVGSVYLGYAPTYVGAVIGGLWGLLDGAFAGAFVAWLYNRL